MTRAERLSISLAAFFITAVIGYASVRGVEILFFPEANPAVVVWSERSGFLWRSAIALYIGGLGAFGGYALASAAPELAARWLPRAVLLAAAAILAQGALLP